MSISSHCLVNTPIYLENTLFLLVMFYISCCIHSILCDPYRLFGRGRVVGIASDLLLAGRSGDRIPVGGARFSTPLQTCSPPSLLYNGHRVSFPGMKRGVDCSPPFSAEVKERVQLFLYSHPGSSWLVLG